MGFCNVLLILLSLMFISWDHKCFWHSRGFKSCMVYLLFYFKLHIQSPFWHNNTARSKVKWYFLISSSTSLNRCFSSNCTVIYFIQFSWIIQLWCCCIEYKFSSWSMANLKEEFVWTSMKGELWNFSTYSGFYRVLY